MRNKLWAVAILPTISLVFCYFFNSWLTIISNNFTNTNYVFICFRGWGFITLPGHSLSLTEVLLSLNRLNHSKHIVQDIKSFLKACCKSLKISLELFPSFKQNFTYMYMLFLYCIHYKIRHMIKTSFRKNSKKSK